MRKFLANLSIRGSLLGVLAFFSFMLVVGAALGVLSLRVSNDTLQGVKQTRMSPTRWIASSTVYKGRAQRPGSRRGVALWRDRERDRPAGAGRTGPGQRGGGFAAARQGFAQPRRDRIRVLLRASGSAGQRRRQPERSRERLRGAGRPGAPSAGRRVGEGRHGRLSVACAERP